MYVRNHAHYRSKPEQIASATLSRNGGRSIVKTELRQPRTADLTIQGPNVGSTQTSMSDYHV
jgi:hypothetical protein